MLDITDDSDDPVVPIVKKNRLVEGISITQVFSNECFIDYGNQRCLGVFSGGEFTPAHELNSHCVEVTRRSCAAVCLHAGAVVGQTLDGKRATGSRAAEWKVINSTNRFKARHGSQAVKNTLKDLD